MAPHDARDSIRLPNCDETRLPVTRARHAPGLLYTSPELFEQEKETIFMRDWLCVGRAEEIENPGDFMTCRILGEPVLVVRAQSGEVNAFANVCAHRGVEVATGSGNCRHFCCPFHGWTYDLDGRLVGAPAMREAESFPAADCRLPLLQSGVWQGWIFISFAKNPPPLSEHVAPMERDFGYLRQDECRLAVKTVGEFDCNWKLLVENLIDFYHLNVVHTQTNGRTFTRSAFKFTPRERSGYVARYNSGPSTLSGKPVFGRMPWLFDLPDDFASAGLLAPNFTFFARIDDIHPYVTWPLGPNRSRIVVYSLLPRIWFDQPDFAERAEEYRAYQEKLMAEDRAMLESQQNGMASRNYRPGRMAYIERGVHHVLNGYIERMARAETQESGKEAAE